MEVSIAGTDPPYAVLTHENGGMRVVEQIACQMRNLPDNLCGHIRVPLRGYQDTESGRGEQCRDEVPCCQRIPWASHYTWVSRNAQEFVQNGPSRIPGIRTHSLVFEPVSACGMKRGIMVGSVYQYVGVDGEHYRPSMAW